MVYYVKILNRVFVYPRDNHVQNVVILMSRLKHVLLKAVAVQKVVEFLSITIILVGMC